MTTTTNFLGIPVEGDISRSHKTNIEQWDAEKLQSLLLPVINHPEVEGIRWTQYTPYFNDGDTCEFGVNDMQIRVKGMGDDSGDYEDGYEDVQYGTYDPTLKALIGAEKYEWHGEWPNRTSTVTLDPAPSDPELAEAVRTLAKAFPHFENLFLDAFGDHAKVTVKKDIIEVDSYDHD